MQTIDLASSLPVTLKLVLRWNAVGEPVSMEDEAIAEEPVRRAGILAPGSGRPAWIHVDLPKRETAEAAWDPLAGPLHEAGALAAPELDPATRATLRSLGDLGPRSAARNVLALQLLRQDSPRFGELLGVRIVRISTVVIGDVVVSARHRDGIVVVRAPAGGSLQEISAELARDGDALDATGLKARVARVVPPVDAPALRTVVHDAVTAGLVDVVTSLEERLVAGDGEWAAAAGPLERAVTQARKHAPAGQAAESYRESLQELRRMRGGSRAIVDARLVWPLSIGAGVVVVPSVIAGVWGPHVALLDTDGPPSVWAVRVGTIGLALITVQISAWASTGRSTGDERASAPPEPVRGRWPEWLPAAVGLLLLLTGIVLASV